MGHEHSTVNVDINFSGVRMILHYSMSYYRIIGEFERCRGRRWSWYLPRGIKAQHENLHDNWCLARDSNRRPLSKPNASSPYYPASQVEIKEVLYRSCGLP